MNKTLLAAALILGGATLFAGDVLRFRGENSQGKFEEKGLMKAWPQEGLKPKWTCGGLGEGWSSVSKFGNRLYTTGTYGGRQGKESVICLDLDGKIVWKTETGTPTGNYHGARSTPTYVPGEKDGEGRLLVTTGSGEIFCLNAADGKILWSRPVSSEYGTNFMSWGLAESPVVKDGMVFMTAGGSKALVVALKIDDGSVVWTAKSNDDKLGYVTPAIVKDQFIVMTDAKVNGIRIEDGTVMWEDDYRATSEITARNGNNANTPVVKDNRFFVTGGYNRGGVLYELNEDGKGVKVIWKNKDLDPHHDSAVLVDGRLYGSNMSNNNSGKWMCVDWETGKTVYETPWDSLGKGSVVYADGMLYLYEEKRGTLGLAKPGDKFDVVSSFQIDFGNKEHWAHPTICDGVLYLRHGDVLAAFDIKAK